MTVSRRIASLVMASALLIGAISASAQVTSGNIVGRITDSSGAILPGATVTVTSATTGEVRSAPTNASGDYVFNLLPIGTYTVLVELQGFGKQSARIALSAGDRARFDGRMTVGQLAENVTVTAKTSLLQTDTATVSALVTEKAVQDLPVNGRNFVRLVQTVPGAHEGVPNSFASGTRPGDRRQTSAISINGSLDNQNNHLIDGVDNNERYIGTIGVKPSIDAIAEVKVQTNLYTAEVGRTAGGVVNILTKAGGNQFRGSAFEFLRNDRFDARNVFATSKPLLKQHQFGGSVGGPLVRDRTFFFADVEGFRHTSGVVNVATVPTMAMRRGDFSEVTGQVFDPTTTPRSAFPGNQIPQGRFDPIALRYLALYPQPNAPGLANNWRGVRERSQNAMTADGRVDHRVNEANSVFARYSWNDVDTFTPGILPAVNGVEPGGNPGAFAGPSVGKAHGLQGNHLHIFSPSLLSEFKVGYTSVDMRSLPLNQGTNLAREFGIANANIDGNSSHLTPMLPTGYTAVGDGAFIPLILVNDTVQISGAVTNTRGAHNIRIGGGIIARKFTVLQSTYPVGQYTFDGTLTNNGAGAGGHAIASFLLGYPRQVRRSTSLIVPYYHTNEPNLYVQDDWRATSWLTLNAGVRYDVFTPLTEERDQLSNLNLDTLQAMLAGKNGVSRSAGVKTDLGNIAPRFGFSATLPGRMVLRGGYGLSFVPGNYMSQMLLKNPPFVSAYGPVLSAAVTGGAPSIRLGDGLPLPVATDAVNLSGEFVALEQDFKSTRMQQFNVNFEKEFGGNVAAVGYVGSRGDNVAFVIPNINLAPVGPGAIDPRRRFAARLPSVSTVTLFADDFESSYDAMQLVLQRRFRDGLSFSTHYTLAHSTWTQPAPWDITTIERFDADFDMRHRWVLTANYELPFARGARGVTGAVLAGWQINAVASWQTGLPFTISNLAPRTNTGGADRPNQIGDPEIDNPTIARWFNPAAFEAQPINTVGSATVARTSLHGPPQRWLDLSLFKDLRVRGAARLQLRVEGYNVTNTPSFGNPNGQLGSPAIGTINSTLGTPRQLQFAAKLLF
jgi:hypothetical protein